MADLVVRRTGELSTEELGAGRDLLVAAFEGCLTAEDWDHTLGGLHVLVQEAGVTVAHAAVVHRTLVAGQRRLLVGYVEGVATAPDRRRRGHATRAMQTVAAIITRDYDLGTLSADVPEFYARLGWEPWRGFTYVHSPGGRVRTPDEDDGVMVLRTDRTSGINLTAELTCDWRPGDAW